MHGGMGGNQPAQARYISAPFRLPVVPALCLLSACILACSEGPAETAAASSSGASAVPIAPAAAAASSAAAAGASGGTAAAAGPPPRKPGSKLVSPREAAAKLKQLLPSGRGKSERSELLESSAAAAAPTGAAGGGSSTRGSGGAASSSAAPTGNSRWAAATRDQQASYQRSASEIKRVYGRSDTGRCVTVYRRLSAGRLGTGWLIAWLGNALLPLMLCTAWAATAALTVYQPAAVPVPPIRAHPLLRVCCAAGLGK
jgi:hypothetical protein